MTGPTPCPADPKRRSKPPVASRGLLRAQPQTPHPPPDVADPDIEETHPEGIVPRRPGGTMTS